MSKVVKRNIVVEGIDYCWTLNGNRIDGRKVSHIKVHLTNLTRSILYIDPYDWSFEIRPKIIRKGILFAISQGWSPEQKNTEMIIAMKNDEFYVLPSGEKFGFESEI